MKPPIASTTEIHDGPAAWFHLFAQAFALFGGFSLGFILIEKPLDWLACNLDGICR